MVIRKPVVAGQFYPGTKKELEKAIATLVGRPGSRLPAKGAVIPHAGYAYSGAVAAHTASVCDFKDTIILIGPKHTESGEPFSVMTEGVWQTPLGDVEIDIPLAQRIVKNSRYLKSDTLAHRFEHSLEVILPFLQYTKKDMRIVPIVVSYANITVCKTIAADIAGALSAASLKDAVSVIASSDMTHYEPQEAAHKADHYAIEAILHLDAEELLERVQRRRISMCGVIPVAIMLEITKQLGARHAELIQYQTSGDTGGDYSSVVGYAGIRVS